MNDIELIAQLSVISDAQAGHLVSDAARADLAERIMAVPVAPPRGRQAAERGRWPAVGRSWRRRRWAVTAGAAGLAAAGLVAAVLAGTVGSGGPRPNGPAVVGAQALAFVRHGRYIDVIVRNPLADPKKYRAEFRAHHLNVSLELIPVSPSLVGTVVYFGGSGTSAIRVITARGRCFTGGGGPICPVGLRVPVDFRGDAQLVFGRAARPGEKYESTASSTAPGEALHGLHIRGRHVSAVLAMIARRHVTVAVYHVTTAKGGELLRPGKVPGRWWVYGADPWAPGQVMLWVGATRTPPALGAGNPRTPVTSPTPTASAG